jgi:hypothetical protein
VTSRAAAERTADALLSRRAEHFEQRERELRGLVADFHHAAQQAAKVRSDLEARARRVLADAEAKAGALRERAENEAAEFDAKAHAAVRAMLDFGESRQAVAELTGLSAAKVRQLQRDPASLQGKRPMT